MILPVILARNDSLRLPGKVSRPILGGKSIIEILHEQIALISTQLGNDVLTDPVIATTQRSCDNPIRELAKHLGVSVHSGHIMPLCRIKEIISDRADLWVWRINADSPLLLSNLIDEASAHIRNESEGKLKVITNLSPRSFPYGISLEMYFSNFINGLDLERLGSNIVEHITPVQGLIDEQFILNVTNHRDLNNSFDSSVRLTIDHEDDVRFFSGLWGDDDFLKLNSAGYDRVDYAYNKRMSYES